MQEKSFSLFRYVMLKKYFHKFILMAIILLFVVAETTSAATGANFLLSSRSALSTNYSLEAESSVTLRIAEPSASITRGQKARYSINIDRSNFPDVVELGLSQISETQTPGITFSYSKSSTVEDTVTLEIITNGQTPVGVYNFVVTGKASGLNISDSNRLTLAVNREQQDLILTLSPDTLTAIPGQSANFILTSNTPFESLALSITGLPLNTTSSFSSQDRRSINLSINTNTNTPLGSYAFTVTGIAGSFTRKVTGTLVVQPAPNTVTLQVNQPTLSINQGQTANYVVSVNRSNVTLPVELGLVSLNNTSVQGLTFNYTQNPTTANSTVLNIVTAITTPPGTYTFQVTGKASGITIANSNTITLAVTAPAQDFSLSLSPNAITVRQGSTANLSINRVNVGGSTNPISLNVTGLPAGVTTSFPTGNNFPLPLQIVTTADTPVGTYNITLTGTRGGFTRNATATLTVQSANTLPQSVRVEVNQPTITVNQGETAKYSVNVSRINFASAVTLGIRMLNGTTIPGLSVTYSQNPTTASFVGLNLATSSNTPAGTYSFVLTGRASNINISDSSSFTLIVKSTAVQQPDFSLSLSPSSVTVKAGETANYTLIRNDSNGFSSNLSVSVAGIPSNSVNGLPATFSFPISLPIITSTDTPAGTYTITVSGVGGGLTRTTTAILRVEALANPKSVTLQANQTLATINQGQSASFPIAINRTNFADSVELGLRTLNGTTIPGLTFGYSQNPTTASNVSLNITTTNSIPVGTYTFVTTGKASGLAIADSNAFTLVVNSNIQPDFSLSLSPSSLTVKPGETATYTLNRNSVGGFSSDVVLSINGLPSGATSNVTSISGSSINLPIITNNNTPLGNYTLTITGVSGNLTRTVSASLAVEPVKPMIASVGYIKPLLSINGTNFGTDVRVFVNNKEVTSFIRNLSASLVELRANKKKLGLRTGSNQIKLISNGVESNTVLVSAFSDESLVFLGEEIINTNSDDYFSKRTPKIFDSVDELDEEQPLVKEERFGVRED